MKVIIEKLIRRKGNAIQVMLSCGKKTWLTSKPFDEAMNAFNGVYGYMPHSPWRIKLEGAIVQSILSTSGVYIGPRRSK